MPVYEVRESTHVKEHNGVAIYKLALWADGQTTEAELFDSQKLNPQVGQKIDGLIEQSQFGPKLKVARKGNGPGFKGRSPEDRALDREKNRSIMGESALKTAVEYAGVLGRAGRLPEEFTGASVVQLAEVFYGFIERKTQEGS